MWILRTSSSDSGRQSSPDAARVGVMVLHVFGQVGEIDEVAGRRDAGAGNDVFEFADVARPGMLEQHGLSPAREAGNFFAIGFVVLF